jgi:hypothetical protein
MPRMATVYTFSYILDGPQLSRFPENQHFDFGRLARTVIFLRKTTCIVSFTNMISIESIGFHIDLAVSESAGRGGYFPRYSLGTDL